MRNKEGLGLLYQCVTHLTGFHRKIMSLDLDGAEVHPEVPGYRLHVDDSQVRVQGIVDQT